jgi:hypothetical protein
VWNNRAVGGRSTGAASQHRGEGIDNVTSLGIDRDRYERDGFEVVASLCTPDEVAGLRAVCDQLLADHRPAGTDDPYALAVLHEPAEPELLALVERARAVAEFLLTGEVDPTFVLLHAVTETADRGRGWHQALAYNRLPYSPRGTSVPLDEIEVLVVLEEVTAAEMALMFAPGYHVLPMLEHRRVPSHAYTFELVDPTRQLLLHEAVPVPLHPGDAVAYTLGTPHSCIYARDAEVQFLRVGFRVRSVGADDDAAARLAG